jgi:hypothetical protein
MESRKKKNGGKGPGAETRKLGEANFDQSGAKRKFNWK